MELIILHKGGLLCYHYYYYFYRFLERLKVKTKTLGKDGDLETYLSERLCCPLSEIQTIFQHNPNLSRIHIIYVKNKLDLLFSEGFTPEDVKYVCVSTIFCFSFVYWFRKI